MAVGSQPQQPPRTVGDLAGRVGPAGRPAFVRAGWLADTMVEHARRGGASGAGDLDAPLPATRLRKGGDRGPAPDSKTSLMMAALIEAKGAFLTVAALALVGYGRSDATTLRATRARLSDARSLLRVHGVAATVESTGAGDSLSYAWRERPAERAPQHHSQPAIPGGITLPPVGCHHCVFDGDSLIEDGVKRERARPA